MKILYQIPSLHTIYVGRTIYNGYKHAFEDMGHSFRALTAEDNPQDVFKTYKPDILFTSLNFYCLKYLPVEMIQQYKKNGGKVFVNIGFWKSPISKLRINEVPSISENREYVSIISSGTYGDIFFNFCKEGDLRMEGFEKDTGYQHTKILLAADKTMHFPEYAERFKADISFIGTYLPEKRKFIEEYVYPLKKKHDLKLYGQDWTIPDRFLGVVQKGGQFFNIPVLRSIRKPKLQLEDERRIYSSSLVSINIHEEYQKRFGGDSNERTFKIPACGGFEITDDVACIRDIFVDGKEIVIAKNKKDWFDKINYYIQHPDKRLPIIAAGRKKVLKYHTYHNRVDQIINLYKQLK